MARTFAGTFTTTQVLSNPATDNPATVTSTGTIDVNSTAANAVGLNGNSGFAWTVTNLGTVESIGNNGFGVVLQSGGLVTNGASGSTGGLITAVTTGVQVNGSAGTITNFGTIASTTTGTSGGAIDLGAGGLITNYGLIVGARGPRVVGTATGYGGVITTVGTASTIRNFGTITSSGTNISTGINLLHGGLIVNGATGALIAGSLSGIYAGGHVLPSGSTYHYPGALTTVVNYGTIRGGIGQAVLLVAGGTVTNSGLIANASTAHAGVSFHNTAGKVLNSGTIESTGNQGVYFQVGGSVANAAGGVISGGKDGVDVLGSAGTVVNSGRIQSTGAAAGDGVYFGQGGVVTNQTSGRITAYHIGISVHNTAGTVVNFGTIVSTGTGTSGHAIYLGAGGSVTNHGLLSGAQSGSPVSGTSGGYPGVISTRNQRATVANLGTITNTDNGNGVNLLDGGLLINGSTSLTSASISAPHNAVYVGGILGVPTPGAIGTVVNYGTIRNTTSLGSDVRLVSGGMVTNRGLISSPRTGISFGGTVAGTVVNFGIVRSTAPTSFTAGTGIYLQSGGVITNAAGASITALRSAVAIGNTAVTSAAAIVSNAGTITGSIGVSVGLADTGSNTIINSGTIIGTGGTAVAFNGGGNRLIVDPGAVFGGGVNLGAGTGNVLELAAGAATGTIGGPGSSYTGVDSLAVDNSARWLLLGSRYAYALSNAGTLEIGGTLTGGSSVANSGVIDIQGGAALDLHGGASGSGTIAFLLTGDRLQIGTAGGPATLSNAITQFAPGDTIDMAGLVTNGETYAGGVLTLTNSGTVAAQLTLSTPIANPVFSLGTDGSGGTDVTVSGPSAPVINAVSWNNATQSVVITGSGFGAQSPYNGDGNFLALDDLQEGPGGTGWGAGFTGTGLPEFDLVTLNVTSWTNTKIVISGFTGSYGSNNWVFLPGDQVVVGVSNANGIPPLTHEALAAKLTVTVPSLSLTGTFTSGIVLSNPTTQNPATLATGGSVTNTTTLHSGDAVYGTNAAAWKFTNLGMINATGTASHGVRLVAGGTVTNRGIIAGAADGVVIANTSGAVINLGIIKGTSLSASQVTGVSLFGGSITNGAGTVTTALIKGVQYGAEIGNAAGTVLNFGSIVATATGGDGLRLVHGGTIDNLGAITGPGAGIFLDIATSVTNGKSGTAKGYISGQTGVDMEGPGTIINFGRIVGTAAGATTGLYLPAGGVVHNYGTIVAAGTAGDAVSFHNGGANVVNGKNGSAAGLISGVGAGIAVGGSGGTVTNFAGITGGSDGVDLSGSVAVVLNNFGTLDGGSHGAYLGGSAGAIILNSGLINGGAEGIHTRDAAATVTNSGTGTIEGDTGNAINLTDGGTVTNQGRILSPNATQAAINISNAPGSVNNSGSISGGTGILFNSVGAVTNTGTIDGTGTAGNGVDLAAGGRLSNTTTTALIVGGDTGVIVIGTAGTVVNIGTITGGLTGVILDQGGTVKNGQGGAAGGLIAGYCGVCIYNTAGTIDNFGTVRGTTGFGAYLQVGGTVSNGQSGGSGGLITGSMAGVYVHGGRGRIVNFGTIDSSGTGGIGIELRAGGLVRDAGSISGASSTAISFGGTSANRLVLDPGYQLGGMVVGSASAGATNTLELGSAAGTGTLSAVIGNKFLNFGMVSVDVGARWVIASNNTIGAGSTLTVAGTLTDLGTLTNMGAITGGGELIVDPATLINSGSIGMTVTLAGGGYLGNKTTGKITAAGDAVVGTGGAATVVNQGQITGTAGTGVRLLAGGRVTNQGSGSITGGFGGVYILGAVGTLSNSGRILSSGGFDDGVFLDTGGIVSNSGLVSGLDGVDLRGSGTVTNSGMIVGSGSGNVGGIFLGFNYSAGAFRVNNTGSIISSATGVLMRGAGTIDNGSSAATGATISGSIGVQIIFGVGTMVNFGTITGTGGIAISLGAGNDRVVIEHGSVLQGAVAGFHPGDTFDLPFMSFSSSGTVTLEATNVLRVVENGGTFNIKLDPSQNFTGDFFDLGSDGGGGTLVTETRPPYSISPNPASVLDNAGHLTFTITRTNTSGPAVIYASVVQDQGYTNNGDYTFVNDMEVNFATGVASVQVSVGITDTGAASGSEVFRFIIQQNKTDPVTTFLASDKFTITNTTAPAAAATPRFTFADIAPTGLNSGAANSGSPSNYLPGAIAANEQAHAGGPLLFATGHSGGALLSLAGGANHHSPLPAPR